MAEQIKVASVSEAKAVAAKMAAGCTYRTEYTVNDLKVVTNVNENGTRAYSEAYYGGEFSHISVSGAEVEAVIEIGAGNTENAAATEDLRGYAEMLVELDELDTEIFHVNQKIRRARSQKSKAAAEAEYQALTEKQNAKFAEFKAIYGELNDKVQSNAALRAEYEKICDEVQTEHALKASAELDAKIAEKIAAEKDAYLVKGNSWSGNGRQSSINKVCKSAKAAYNFIQAKIKNYTSLTEYTIWIEYHGEEIYHVSETGEYVKSAEIQALIDAETAAEVAEPVVEVEPENVGDLTDRALEASNSRLRAFALDYEERARKAEVEVEELEVINPATFDPAPNDKLLKIRGCIFTHSRYTLKDFTKYLEKIAAIDSGADILEVTYEDEGVIEEFSDDYTPSEYAVTFEGRLLTSTLKLIKAKVAETSVIDEQHPYNPDYAVLKYDAEPFDDDTCEPEVETDAAPEIGDDELKAFVDAKIEIERLHAEADEVGKAIAALPKMDEWGFSKDSLRNGLNLIFKQRELKAQIAAKIQKLELTFPTIIAGLYKNLQDNPLNARALKFYKKTQLLEMTASAATKDALFDFSEFLVNLLIDNRHGDEGHTSDDIWAPSDIEWLMTFTARVTPESYEKIRAYAETHGVKVYGYVDGGAWQKMAEPAEPETPPTIAAAVEQPEVDETESDAEFVTFIVEVTGSDASEMQDIYNYLEGYGEVDRQDTSVTFSGLISERDANAIIEELSKRNVKLNHEIIKDAPEIAETVNLEQPLEVDLTADSPTRAPLRALLTLLRAAPNIKVDEAGWLDSEIHGNAAPLKFAGKITDKFYRTISKFSADSGITICGAVDGKRVGDTRTALPEDAEIIAARELAEKCHADFKAAFSNYETVAAQFANVADELAMIEFNKRQKKTVDVARYEELKALKKTIGDECHKANVALSNARQKLNDADEKLAALIARKTAA